MTDSQVVSVKIPSRILEKIPAPGYGRSRFIIEAIEEKLSRRKQPQWEPKTDRGRRLSALLKKGLSERMPLLTNAQIEQELSTRRGRSL
jgi:hypothetical protein